MQDCIIIDRWGQGVRHELFKGSSSASVGRDDGSRVAGLLAAADLERSAGQHAAARCCLRGYDYDYDYSYGRRTGPDLYTCRGADHGIRFGAGKALGGNGEESQEPGTACGG